MRIASYVVVVVTAVCGLAPSSAQAQRVPFFAGAATGFDPEISVVNSGAVLDAQAVVSHDRRYVTINARPQNSQLLALRAFSFAGGGRAPRIGLVGGAGRDDDGEPNVLDRRGTSLVTRLED